MEQLLRSRFELFNEPKLRSLRAVDKYDVVVSFLGLFNSFCGTFFLHADFRWNYRTWITVTLSAAFCSSFVYTFVHHWNDWYCIVELVSVSGIGFQGVVKFYSALLRIDYFQGVNRDLRAMYAKYSTHPENNYALTRCSLFILYLCRFLAVLYATAGIFMFLPPLYMFYTKQKRLLPIPLLLVFTDDSTVSGYIINMAYSTVIITFAVPGIVAGDTGILLIVLQIIGITDTFRNYLKELDRMLEDPNCSQMQVHDKITEICKMHKEIIEYEESLDNVYHSTVFVQVITSVTGLSLTMFLIYMLGDWHRIMFLLASLFQLLEFCLLGTSLTMKNDEIRNALYDTKWYLLSTSDQKRLAIILHRSQNAVEMTIGGLYLLNMETFVEIIKTIYSYFTMLITFLE